MTEQPTIQDPHSSRTAGDLTPEMIREMNDRRVREDIERRDRAERIDRAFTSPEAEKIRHVVVEDGNVEWRDFVKYCGGILEVVAMVDEYGLPDTDRIIPKVDEMHAAYVQKLRDAGHVLIPGPRNRPYVPGPGTSAGEAAAAAKRGNAGAAKYAKYVEGAVEAHARRGEHQAAWSRGR